MSYYIPYLIHVVIISTY